MIQERITSDRSTLSHVSRYTCDFRQRLAGGMVGVGQGGAGWGAGARADRGRQAVLARHCEPRGSFLAIEV